MSRSGPARATFARRLRQHLPEYASEALGLAMFMVSACAFTLALEHPDSRLRGLLPDALVRRALMGIAMGATLVANVHAPWGRRSGAHLNPATTLAFWRLGRVTGADLLGYWIAQFAGGSAGVALMAWWAGPALAHPSVRYVVTQPGAAGAGVAFAAEFTIAFVLLSVVLRVMASVRHAHLTPWVAGGLVAACIALEAPLSGMSMNPARTFGSALLARDFRAFWVYVAAPPLAMLAAVEAWRVELRWRRHWESGCAKLLHRANEACIFCGQPAADRVRKSGTSGATSAFTTGRRSS